MARRQRRTLPGFSLTLGITLVYLSAIVLIPLGALFFKVAQIPPSEFWRLATNDLALSAYRVTFGSSLAAALVNAVMGTLVAWVLSRYQFPGRPVADALIDFPFALPTAVAGLTLASLFGPRGWLGSHLESIGIKVVLHPLGIVLALTFVGFPFVVRTLQPVIDQLEVEAEEAAALLGAGRWYTFRRVIVPALLPAILTGFAMAFARAVGEYGSVIFVAGNKAYESQIAPVLIVSYLEQFEYGGAMTVAVVLLALSLGLLLTVNLLERWSSRFLR